MAATLGELSYLIKYLHSLHQHDNPIQICIAFGEGCCLSTRAAMSCPFTVLSNKSGASLYKKTAYLQFAFISVVTMALQDEELLNLKIQTKFHEGNFNPVVLFFVMINQKRITWMDSQNW